MLQLSNNSRLRAQAKERRGVGWTWRPCAMMCQPRGEAVASRGEPERGWSREGVRWGGGDREWLVKVTRSESDDPRSTRRRCIPSSNVTPYCRAGWQRTRRAGTWSFAWRGACFRSEECMHSECLDRDAIHLFTSILPFACPCSSPPLSTTNASTSTSTPNRPRLLSFSVPILRYLYARCVLTLGVPQLCSCSSFPIYALTSPKVDCGLHGLSRDWPASAGR